MPENNIAETVEQIVSRSKTHTHLANVTSDGLLVFSDKSVLQLERFAANPRRKRAVVTANDQDSFARYVNAHKRAFVTALFGQISESGGSFSGIIDFHEQYGADKPCSTQPEPRAYPDGLVPNWGEHRVNLTLAFTPEWVRWTKNDGVALAQLTFAELIEDNLPDIVHPQAADLLEIVQDLTAKKDVNFKSTSRLNNGQVGIIYDETITTGKREGQIDLPREFTISIAPFRGSAPVGINVRLRFRITDGVLQFVYRLNQPHKVLENAFDSARSYIEHQTQIPVLLGSASVSIAPTS
jgi:uncharacterized protein YfdQ (DUF2303 family)